MPLGLSKRVMKEVLHQCMGWVEVWALFIPLIAFIGIKRYTRMLNPILFYILVAIVLNFAQDYIQKYGIKLRFTSHPGNNGFIYNTHSIFRFFCFSLFFIQLKQPFLSSLKKIFYLIFIVFIIINFWLYESFLDFSSRTLAVETALLLFFCLIYYFNLLQYDEPIAHSQQFDFWIITGISIFVVLVFPIYLFYNNLSAYQQFARQIWNIHNIAYIILCCFFAKGIYETKNI